MRSLILSQCRDLRMGVLWENLGALTCKRVLICWSLEAIYLKLMSSHGIHTCASFYYRKSTFTNITNRTSSIFRIWWAVVGQSETWRCWSELHGHRQWSNYEGARGGLAPLKDRVAPSKHLVWEGIRGPLKGPPEITRQIQYMIATYQYHSKHHWWYTVPSYMTDKPCSIFDQAKSTMSPKNYSCSAHLCVFINTNYTI